MPDANSTVLSWTTIRPFESQSRVRCGRLAWMLSFACISDFLKFDPPDRSTCLVLDVRLPVSVQAMKGGAIEFLTKPFRDQDLLDAIRLGLSRDHVRRENDKALAALRERFGSLSPRSVRS